MEAETKALRILVTFLLEQARDLYARHEALRIMVERHGGFSHEEYDTLRADAEEQWNVTVAEQLSSALEGGAQLELKRLLGELKGPPH